MCDTILFDELWNGISQDMMWDAVKAEPGEIKVTDGSIDDSFQPNIGSFHTTNLTTSQAQKIQERKRKNRLSAQKSRTKQKLKMIDLENGVHNSSYMIEEQAKIIARLKETNALLTNENEALREKIRKLEIVSSTGT
jgi:hypothetical protein